MEIRTPPVKATSETRVTFWDPETGQRIAVRNAVTGRMEWGGTWHPNMITDVGLDMIETASLTATQANLNPSRGTLTLSGSMTEIKEPSGAVTAQQAGTTVTASAPFFSAGDVGRAIVWADGSNARITAYVSATEVSVDKDQAVADQPFERWHVNISSVPGMVQWQRGDDPGGFTGLTYTYDSNYWLFHARMARIITLTADRNVSGFGLGETNRGSDAMIIDCIRDGSGAPITISALAGKAIRVDSTVTLRWPRAPQQVQFIMDEYDAANQLIDTHEFAADFWLSPRSLSTDHVRDMINRLLPSVTSTGGRLYTFNAAGLTPGQVEGVPHGDDRNGPSTTAGNVSQVPAYVAGSREKTYNTVMAAANGNGQVRVLSDCPGSNLNPLTNALTWTIQLRDNAHFMKEPTHTLRAGIVLSWDRDYTV